MPAVVSDEFGKIII